jgi:very-short-patch-repair endonuclease
MNQNTEKLTRFAREFRRNHTDTERFLWHYLRNRHLMNLKFRRQEPIGNFIADFLCYEKKLIIEVDGGQHSFEQEYDRKRAEWIEKQGFEILRFWDNEVLENMEGVIYRILEHCGEL